jgi:2-polyprenyl-6-methoxyphenol hydroxylase-like FAD-dependent oxidoreductase
VLVGDALHYKDPVDGQGIYDALLEARVLDEALGAWHAGERGWDEAMAGYVRGVRDGTHTMFKQTVGRLRRELYQEPPAVMVHTLLRWMMTDAGYHKRFMHYFSRALPGDRLLTPQLIGGVVARGIGRDLRSLLRRPPHLPSAADRP